MPVRKEASGRRSIDAEAEVIGSPDEVWRAIASGPGVSSWFVPTTIEGRVGGSTSSDFGPGMLSAGRITAWDPPRRFVAEMEEGPGTVASEWTVEAQAGGTCRVRVVQSWFASTDDWDQQFEGASYGWIAAFQILARYLHYFPGQACVPVQLAGMSSLPVKEAWQRLVAPLGLEAAVPGAVVAATPGAPPLGGVVEVVNPPDWPGLLMRLDVPGPALAHFFAMPIGPQCLLPVRFYLYGPAGAAMAATVEAEWQAWLNQRLDG